MAGLGPKADVHPLTHKLLVPESRSNEGGVRSGRRGRVGSGWDCRRREPAPRSTGPGCEPDLRGASGDDLGRLLREGGDRRTRRVHGRISRRQPRPDPVEAMDVGGLGWHRITVG
jgi:hypothetical protein